MGAEADGSEPTLPSSKTPGPPLTATVITFQEEDRIAGCLQSLDFCDELIVVDSGSTDRTREIATELGARVIVNTPFPGHKEQKQHAIEQARTDWVLCLDADERILPPLRTRILELKAAGFTHGAYEMPRQNHYLGKRIRRGLFWPDRKIRLFDRRRARWGGVNPHDRVEIGDGSPPFRLEEAFEHESYRSFKDHLQAIDKLTRLDAAAKHAAGRTASLLDLLLKPPAIFLKGLILKLGFVDGWRGLLICCMGAYYNWKKTQRLRQLNRQGRTSAANEPA